MFALLAGFSHPVFMPFRALFLQMRKEDAYTYIFHNGQILLRAKLEFVACPLALLTVLPK